MSRGTMIRTMCAAGALVCATAGLGQAAWEAGAGMEYFTLNTEFKDSAGLTYRSILQGTLTHARASWSASGWMAAVTGGWSDWNVSGEWQIPGWPIQTADAFGWAAQTQWSAEAHYRFLYGFTAGARFSQRDLKHHDGFNRNIYLRYQEQNWEGMLGYQWQPAPSLTISAAAGFSPASAVTFYQHMYYPDIGYEVIRFETRRTGVRWQGRLAFRYRDSAGWGLDLDYALARSAFGGTPAVSATTGGIAGALVLMF